MGNAMSCFDRWGKRTPDGALFVAKRTSGGADPPKGASAFATPAISAASTAASTGSAARGGKTTLSAAPAERSIRRRQTYSSTKAAESEVSSYDDGDDFEESEDEEELTTKDVRQQKLLDYRRKLTKIVKLKTHLFNATVKVTCSRDGKEIEWYKGQSAEGRKNKPVGSMPVEKIVTVKSQADNPKGLIITVNNPNPVTYSFTFKSKEERVSWQEQLESFQKFMSLR
ncbi:hypothetical protein Efla_005027 [Eimeria flavescens]